MVILPASAVDTLSGDDEKFITDVTTEGLPLLNAIPDIMKDGFFNGNESTLQTVNKTQTEKINTFVKKVNEYKLSEKVTPVRNQYINTTELFKTDLTEYSTLTNSCGSCVAKMNEMYPKLLEEVNKTSSVVNQYKQA
ncbi:hypothetical protein [Methanospirillum lacunae]|uniref:Uncharacterized protein n=1 Tax=Methanospirillum lacunae TaxID=668570 RepID=A0A2V2N2J8_9EURY|nr:hypothetical protein [Methanospirillum lacunae]PWR74372.1 hypothetical protein DK846_04270 [Methanospirillum lacunae]